MRRRTNQRWAVSLGVTVASLAAGLVLSSPPAGASTTPVGLTHLEPVTWVDGQGRQYVLGDQAFGFGPTASSYQLFVMRDRADGEPDTTWGGDGTNKRTLAPTPPATGATIDEIAAVTSSGTITLIWDAAGCSGGVCDRWFQQIDATGATVAAPVLVEGSGRPFEALADGSVLASGGTGTISWLGPDGVERGAPALGSASMRAGALDGAGRLLIASSDGKIQRWPAGGPADLTVETGCSSFAAVGATTSATGGFAAACSAPDQPVSLIRFTDAGTVAWTGSDTAAPNSASRLRTPTDLAITADGVVWVGGGGVFDAGGNFDITTTAVASFAPDGTIASAYERPTLQPGHYDFAPTGVSEIRPVDSTHVAIADMQNCCTTIAGYLPQGTVTGQVLPLRPAPPSCTPAPPYILAATESTLDVRFTTCAADGAANHVPTGYHVEVTSTAGTVTKDVDESTPAKQITTTVTGVPAGRLLKVDLVPFNDQGDSVGPLPTPAWTVAPFRDVGIFAARPYDEGNCELIGLSEGDAQRDLIAAGTLAPEDHVANILERCEAEHRIEPVARLYQAALVRTPDISGLRYWVNRSRTGTQLRSIASSFAGSREFRRRYGSLTNRKYVEQIYQNVLGRPGDPSGIAFWTKRLDTRKETRGGVLAGFSESSEHVRRTDPQMQPAAAWFLMLDRLPTAAERTTIATFDEPRQDAALAILAMSEYAARLSA